MGYQNKSRPRGKKTILIDVYFDLDDLKNDIENNVSKKELIKAINFIRTSVKMARKLLEK